MIKNFFKLSFIIIIIIVPRIILIILLEPSLSENIFIVLV